MDRHYMDSYTDHTPETGDDYTETSSLSNPVGGSNKTIFNFHMVSIINCVAGTSMTLLTFSGQVMVFIVVSRDMRLRTPGNYFIVSLAVADILLSLISMPVWTLYGTLGYWPFSEVLCDTWNAIDVILSNVSIYTILFISVDRFLSLKDPIGYSIKRTSVKATLALVGIWIACILIHGSIISVTQRIYGQGRDPRDCQVFYLQSLSVTLFMSGVNVWCTVSLTLGIYIRVYSIVQKSSGSDMKVKKQKETKSLPKNNEESSCESHNSGNADPDLNSSVSTISRSPAANRGAEDQHPGGMRKSFKGGEADGKQRKAVRTIALLLVTFAVCWLPLSVILVVAAISPHSVSNWWFIGSYWLGYVNSMINPLCYAFGNPYFKETLKSMCKCKSNR